MPECPVGRPCDAHHLGSYSIIIPFGHTVQAVVTQADFYRCMCPNGTDSYLCQYGHRPSESLCQSVGSLDAVPYVWFTQQANGVDGRVFFLKQLRMLEQAGRQRDGWAVLCGVVVPGRPYLMVHPLLCPHERAVMNKAFNQTTAGRVFEQATAVDDFQRSMEDLLFRLSNEDGMLTRWNEGRFDVSRMRVDERGLFSAGDA